MSFKCGLQALNYDFRKMSEGVVFGKRWLGSGVFLWSLKLAMGASQTSCGIWARPSVSLGLFSSPLTKWLLNSLGVLEIVDSRQGGLGGCGLSVVYRSDAQSTLCDLRGVLLVSFAS